MSSPRRCLGWKDKLIASISRLWRTELTANLELLTLAKALSVKNRLAGRLAQARENQGHRIKIGGLGRMANSAFGGKLNPYGTCSHLFTMFVVYLVVDNKYNVYVR